MKKQLDYVIDRCVTALDANMPIIFLETEDMAIVDRLLRSERLVSYWTHDASKDGKSCGWQEMTDEDKQNHKRPDNVNIFMNKLPEYFKDTKSREGNVLWKMETFVAQHENFEYYNSKDGHGVRRIIACRNFQCDEVSAKHLQRLVGEHISALPGDGILNHTFILQGAVVDIPSGLADYVEVITVPSLVDGEIKEIIIDYAEQNKDKLPYKRLLDTMIVQLRGFTQPKIKELLCKIRSQCGSISRNYYDESLSIEKVAVNTITGEKKQMLQKSGLLRNREVGSKEAAGLEYIKEWVSLRKPLIENSLNAKQEWALDAPKGVLVSGIPGTGKSLLAQEVARIMDLPLIQMDMGATRSKYQGESERNMRRVIHLAESLAPCVLWIDEIEKAFSGTKGSGEVDGGTTMRIFASFLNWMQEKEAACFIFATANDVSMLPPEFLRRGRFDQKFFTFMPTKAECITIFRSCIQGKDNVYGKFFDPAIISDEFLANILSFCGKNKKFLTGADIEGVVSDAKFIIYSKCRKSSMQVGDLKYSAVDFKEALEKAIMDARTYGETNKENIVECLLSLARNQFSPSSRNNLIDIRKVDLSKKRLPGYDEPMNDYDEFLYKQIEETMREMFPDNG